MNVDYCHQTAPAGKRTLNEQFYIHSVFTSKIKCRFCYRWIRFSECASKAQTKTRDSKFSRVHTVPCLYCSVDIDHESPWMVPVMAIHEWLWPFIDFHNRNTWGHFTLARLRVQLRKPWAEPKPSLSWVWLGISDPSCMMFTLVAWLRLSQAPSRASVNNPMNFHDRSHHNILSGTKADRRKM